MHVNRSEYSIIKKIYSGNQTLKNPAVGHLKISDQSENITSEQNISSQNKQEFCNERQHPNLFKQ